MFHRICSGAICSLFLSGIWGFGIAEPHYGLSDFVLWSNYHWSYFVSVLIGGALGVLFFFKKKPNFEIVIGGWFFAWVGVLLSGFITETCKIDSIYGGICHFPPFFYPALSVVLTVIIYEVATIIGNYFDKKHN